MYSLLPGGSIFEKDPRAVIAYAVPASRHVLLRVLMRAKLGRVRHIRFGTPRIGGPTTFPKERLHYARQFPESARQFASVH
jgi:hypothetical protein